MRSLAIAFAAAGWMAAATAAPLNGANSLIEGRLFVGTCYQPVDRSPAQIIRDIQLIKDAGFTVVRMGDLSWDYFEPSEGVFEFSAFDVVMDQMQAQGIKVILDIPGLPAPQWLHRKYPGVDVVTQNGTRLPAAERYMDDISDPDYRRLARRMAEALLKRYGHHPALLAVGYDNEIGNGFMSYSRADRTRFIGWLKRRYTTLEELNRAWATQRWSRRIGAWDEVELPLGEGPGPAERFLDLHRYWSDVTVATLQDLEAVRRRHAPDTPAISNLWDSSGRKGFDYLSSYRQYANYGAMGFYPGDPISGGFEALMMKGGLDTPIWFNEFTAGGPGYYGTKGRARMWAYFGLIVGSQATLAWTFNSHLGGEEQALFGLIDHDDTPSWKLSEFSTIATEFGKLQALGFPREVHPQVAVAYSFESRLASNPNGPSNTVRQYITTPYLEQEHSAFAPLFDDNIDVAVINVAHEDLARYKMLVVPGDFVMDAASAAAIRNYVESGGTVIMTAYSAKVDEHSQWFSSALPGRLSDVFGLKTREFYTFDRALIYDFGDVSVSGTRSFYELLEPTTARVLARLANVEGRPPALTENQFGEGRALYFAAPADVEPLRALYRRLYARLGIQTGPSTPAGVFAREVDGRVLYVNTTTTEKIIPVAGQKNARLSGRSVSGELRLPGYGVELVE